MTEEQYKTARKIQSDISDYNEQVNKLQDVINRLNELWMLSSASKNIAIRLNDKYVYILKDPIDYNGLLNYLYGRRDELISRIENAEREFKEL